MMFNCFSKQILFALLVSIVMLSSGCNMSERGCRAGDSFDGNDNEFDSLREGQDDDFRDEKNNQLGNKKDLIKWQRTGFVLNGKKIVVDITGRWTPWGQSTMKTEKPVTVAGETKTILEVVENTCSGFPVMSVVAAREVINDVRYITLSQPIPSNNNPPGTGYPCWLTEGMGLYLLFRAPTAVSPNLNEATIRNPVSGTIHLNRPIDTNANPAETNGSRFVLDFDNNEVKDSTGALVPLTVGMEVYGKINDSYYPDNYGSYTLNFISGVHKSARTPMFKACKDYIVGPVQDVTKKIFMSIVADRAYKRGIYALLILYIVVTAIAYLMGAIQTQLGELTIRIFKIGLVLVLLTPNAWDFFYEHLFKMYLQGVDQMISIIVSGDSQYDPNNTMGFMDAITEKITHPSLMNRFVAALNANLVIGLFYFMIFVIILIFFWICVLWSFAIYIQGMILLSITTAMFPIFLAMILFNFTKQLFQEYIDAILGYSFQIVMTFVILFFMSSMIQWEIQRALGFKICVAPVMNFNPFSSAGSDVMDKYNQDENGNDILTPSGAPQENNSPFVVKSWVPGEGSRYRTIPAFSFFIPGYQIYSMWDLIAGKHYNFKHDIEKIAVPPDYTRKRFRYTSLPFLEPDKRLLDNVMPSGYEHCLRENTKKACHPDKVFPGAQDQHDHSRIKSIMFESHSFKFFDIGDLFVIVLFMFVLWELNVHFGPNIAKWIALSGKGYSMPQALLGSSIISSFKKYEEALKGWADSNNKVLSFVGKGLVMTTTTEGFFMNKIMFKSVGRIANLAQEKGGELVGNVIGIPNFSGESDNRFVRFASQLGGSITDSILYDDLSSRSFAAQARDADRDRENMLGFHFMQDKIGGMIDYDKAIFDKWGASSLVHGLDPTDNPIGRLTGSSETHIARSLLNWDKSMLVENKTGVIAELANAVAGDAINKWSMNHFGEMVFKNDATADGAFAKLFTADASKMQGMYNPIANFERGNVEGAVSREYMNAKNENIDTTKKETEDKTNTMTPIVNPNNDAVVDPNEQLTPPIDGSASTLLPPDDLLPTDGSKLFGPDSAQESVHVPPAFELAPPPQQTMKASTVKTMEAEQPRIHESSVGPTMPYELPVEPTITDEMTIPPISGMQPDAMIPPTIDIPPQIDVTTTTIDNTENRDITYFSSSGSSSGFDLQSHSPVDLTHQSEPRAFSITEPVVEPSTPYFETPTSAPEATKPEIITTDTTRAEQSDTYKPSESSFTTPEPELSQPIPQDTQTSQDSTTLDNTTPNFTFTDLNSTPDKSPKAVQSEQTSSPSSQEFDDPKEVTDSSRTSLVEEVDDAKIDPEIQQRMDNLQKQIDELENKINDPSKMGIGDERSMEIAEARLKQLREQLKILQNR